MNESFAVNMVGKRMSFDVQPYARGIGVITKVAPRLVHKRNEWMLPYGRVNLVYEVFDVTLLVEQGSNTGALWGGVPVAGTTKSLKDNAYNITGMSYSDLHDATHAVDPRTYVSSSCG